MIDFLTMHWRDVVSIGGTVLSLCGIFIAIHQAVKAKNAAEAAKNAADNARSKILNVDLLFDVTRVVGLMDELHGLIGQRAWILVVDRANRICDSIHSVNLQAEGALTKDLRGKLTLASSQVRILATAADKAAVSEGADPDLRKYRKILVSQKAPVLEAMEYLRNSARS